MNDPLDELEALLSDWDAGELDAVGVQRVREILRESETARELYVQHQMLEAALRLESNAGLDSYMTSIDSDVAEPLFLNGNSSAEPNTTAVNAIHRRSLAQWLAIAATLAFVVLSARWGYLEFIGSGDLSSASRVDRTADSVESTAQGVALLTRLVDVEWGSNQTPLEVGQAVSPGNFALQSGFAQLEFFCGATVIIEGPAELDVVSPMAAQVRSGRLRAQVPPAARGFALTVDDLKVIDLGTEFGISVSEKGADVQVFDGEVELQSPSEENRRLTAGQAVIRTDDGGFESSIVQPDRFLDISALESRDQGQQQAKFERWKTWSSEFRNDPRLIAFYAFDQTGNWHRRLPSSLKNDAGEFDGAIVGARQVNGRWPEKKGLEFKHPADRVRMQIPGEYRSLTFSCWVKIDSLDRWYNSLFLTDNYNQGEPHWQILDTGQLFFSVRVSSDQNGGPEHREVLSPPFWNASLSGKWIHLATTYDVDQKAVTHYLNGQLIHREQIPDFQVVPTTRFGPSTLCNWSSPQRPDAHFAIRNLNGSIDEFAILSDALTADEIKEIYEHGKP